MFLLAEGVTNLNGSIDSQYQTFECRRTGSEGGVRARERSGSVASIGGKASTVRNFLTVLALSLHAVFEGLAVGLEDSSNSMWTLFAGKGVAEVRFQEKRFFSR